MYNRIREIKCTTAELEEVRSKFMAAVDTDPNQFDEADINKIMTEEWSVKRFIGYKNNNLTEATTALITSMKWRKSFGVSTIKATDFPSEFFWVGECHTYARDKNNIATVYLRVKFHKQLMEWQPLIKKYLIYIMELMDQEIRNGADGWALIYDCEGGTIFNNNMDLLFFMVQTFFEHYPMALTYIGLYELPWMLRAIYHICRGWIPEDFRKLFIFLNKDNINDYVGTQYLPDYLSGTCNLRYRFKMDGCLNLTDFAIKENIKVSAVNKFLNHYDKFIKLANDEEGKRDDTDGHGGHDDNNNSQVVVSGTKNGNSFRGPTNNTIKV